MRGLKVAFAFLFLFALAVLAGSLIAGVPPAGARALGLGILLAAAYRSGWRARSRLEVVWCRAWAFCFKRYPAPAVGWTRVYRWILRVGPVEARRKDV